MILLSVPMFFSLATPSVVASDEPAELTEAHGQVFKRLSDTEVPVRANLQDKLPVGSQVGTGADSWSQITWAEIVSRQWCNTVVKLLPGKRSVFLSKGEMLFRLKKGGASGEYYVWTKVLQARIRGTTVLFQRTPEVTRVCVVEGTISVHNRIDDTDITLGPGAVYEVLTPAGDQKEKPNEDEQDPQFLPWAGPKEPVESSPPTAINNDGGGAWTPDRTKCQLPSHEICQSEIPPVQLFKSPNSSSSIWIEDRTAVLNHPLLRQFEQPLDSLPIIKVTTDDLPDICFEDRKKKSTNPLADRNRLLGSVIEVINGPSNRKVEVGKELGYKYSLPSPVSAGAKPEVIKVPSIVTRTGYTGTRPLVNKPSSDQKLTDLARQYEDACRRVEEFKTATMREKNERQRRLQEDHGYITPEECQARKHNLEQWERLQHQKCDELHRTASGIKAQIDQLQWKQR